MSTEPTAIGGIDGESVPDGPPPDPATAVSSGQLPAPEQTSGAGPADAKELRAARAAARRASSTRNLIEWFVVVVGALGVALLVNAFLFQPFKIPSSSMYPTLKTGDRVVVNKLSYDAHDVRRGDVVVFTRPTCAGADEPVWVTCAGLERVRDLIKRVIALPGDHLTIAGGHVFVNGVRQREAYLPAGVTTVQAVGCAFPMSYTVPAGHVFVMGDNRSDSFDGRCFGPIPTGSIVGRAFVKIWPFSRFGWL